MTVGFRRRSFSAGSKLARAVPSLSFVEIDLDTYLDWKKRLSFSVFGVVEEILHVHADSAHIRTLRILEKDSQRALTALISGHEDVATAKERIVQNELACEQIYDTSQALVEAVDIHTVQAIHKLVEADPDTLGLGSNIGSREILDRDRGIRELYQKLELLEETFGTWMIPRYAGILALNSPVFESRLPASMRAAVIPGVDYSERFEAMFDTLMTHGTANHGISNPTIHESRDERSDQVAELISFFGDLKSNLAIKIAFPGESTEQLPLLDVPERPTPVNEPPQFIPEDGVVFSVRNPDLVDLYPPRNMISDVYRLFARYGGVIIHADTSPDRYFPNPAVIGKKAGSHSYIREFFESLFAHGVIDQLVEQSVTNMITHLTCPFCWTSHDPRTATCAWDAYLGEVAKTEASAARWPDYLGKTAPVLEDFVGTDVPGEDQLAAYRANRQKAS